MNVGTILIVDDNNAICEFIKTALQDEGYVVLTAANGYEALQVIRQEPVNLILLDMRMPVMDGWQFLAAYYKSRLPLVPVIAMSAHVRNIEENVVAFLSKPFELDTLLELVKLHCQPAFSQN